MFNGKSIADFLTGNVVVPVVVIVAVAVLFFGFSGKVRNAAVAALITLIAFFLIGISTHAQDVGGWLYRLVFGG